MKEQRSGFTGWFSRWRGRPTDGSPTDGSPTDESPTGEPAVAEFAEQPGATAPVEALVSIEPVEEAVATEPTEDPAAPATAEEPDGGDAEATIRIEHAFESLRSQLAICLERLERIEVQTQESRKGAGEEAVSPQPAEDGLARHDERIDQLSSRIQGLEERHVAAAAEEEARREQAHTKQEEYRKLIGEIAAVVRRVVPTDAVVLVVSKGDDRLLELGERRAWHFPRADNGVYAGHHPADSAAAIAHLEALRSKGAQYLVLPVTATWWLDHYLEFKHHLETHHRLVSQSDDPCVIFALDAGAPLFGAASSAHDGGAYAELESVIESFRWAFHRPPAILDWHSGLRLADQLGDHSVFSPPSDSPVLPYLDETIDMVVCPATASELDEARRVSSGVVVAVDSGHSSATDGEAGHGPGSRLDVEWVASPPRTAANDASIIIPCHNQAALTDACLTALMASLPGGFEGEVIVFDDGSTDDTRGLLKQWTQRDERIRLKWRRRNAGFLDACNRAAKAATRDYLVFLNNDTEPCWGWLTALLDTFRRFPKVGVAGGKLILPDGRVQEAGGVIFQDGSAANFQRGETDLSSPLINYVREVDYCSGALLATPRRLFERLGGFDVRFRPAYYEDVDYCFRVRQKGHRVYYQPASTVIHREGGSHGTDLTRGVKRHQVRNQRTFSKLWSDALDRQPARPPDDDLRAWRALAERDVRAT